MREITNDRISLLLICSLVLASLGLFVVGVRERSAAAASGYDDEGKIQIGWLELPAQLNIEHVDTIEASEILSTIHLSLVSTDASGRIFPAVARRWSVTAGGAEYNFELRPGLVFADGDAAACSDVRASFNHYQALHDPSMWVLDLIKGITCPSDSMVQIQLRHPSPYFLSELSDLRYAIRSRKNLLKPGATDLDGLGAYRLREYTPARRTIQLLRKDNYPLESISSPRQIEIVEVDSVASATEKLASGRLDLFPVRGSLNSANQFLVTSNKKDRIWMLTVSRQRFFANPKFAQCLNSLLDRRELVSSIENRSLYPTTSLVSEANETKSAPQAPSKDCAISGRSLRILTLDGRDPKIIKTISAALRRLKIETESRSLSKREFAAALNTNDYDLALFSIGVTSSRMSDLAFFYSRNPMFAPSLWMPSAFSRAIKQLVDMETESTSRVKIDNILELSKRAAPVVPLFFENVSYLEGKCARVIATEKFNLSDQFSSVARLRNCRND